MSGGFFNYQQYHINDIVDDIERELNKQGKPKPKDELWNTEEYYKKYPEELYNEKLSIEVQEEFKRGIKALKIAQIYVQRIDWFLSKDDGEESFFKRLGKELNELETKS